MNPSEYLDALLSLPEIYKPRVSPDGRWAAWTWFRAGPAADVFAAPTDGSQPPVRLSETGDYTILVNWTPDNRAVIVEQDKAGNERVRLYRIDLDDPLTMKPLTEDDPPYYVRGGDLHPNGKWLFYAANFDAEAGQPIESTWVYRHDLETGERVAVVRPARGHYFIPFLSPTGEHLLYTRNELDPGGRQLWLASTDGSSDREIVNAGDAARVVGRWLPDGKRVVVVAEAEAHRRLGIWSLEDESLRWLIDDPARNIELAYAPPGSDRIVVVEIRDTLSTGSLLDPDTGNEQAITGVPGNLIPLAPAPGGKLWTGHYFRSTQPADLVRFNPANPDPETFTSITRIWERTSIRQDDLTPAEDFRWKSVDGRGIQGWLYRAKGEPKGTVIDVHGGPTYHSSDALNAEIQYLAYLGFNVLDPNYRGSTGFSLEYQNSIKLTGWGGLEQDDIRAGIEALIAAGIAAPGKIGMTGLSYGGYSSWCGITRLPPDLLTAAAPVCGMTDLVVDYETTRPDLRSLSEEMMGGSPADVPEVYAERSPINFVGNIKGQVLIVQGLQDPNVTPQNVEEVTRALVDAGVEYQLLAFEDEGHGIYKSENLRKLYPALAGFFEGAFGGK